ncbi:hypothetical protein [Extensimonas vulgaris]|uniref:hypothetical protein n=1 Tax=Extensimonas vulgaris TaxID=1031594 RepID=UPI0013151D0B|nr:hypothetical protein [Extensimonas vulgaris]
MGQEAGKKWAAAAHSQPTIPKSDRLLAFLRRGLRRWSSRFDRRAWSTAASV